MLNTHSGELNSEPSILDRIKAVGAAPESEQEQPETEEAVTLQEDNVEEPIEVESQEEVVYEEEDQHEEQSSEANEEAEESVFVIGDEEITLSQLKELKSGSLRQSDYTKKTTELSDQRKVLEGKTSELTKLSGDLSDTISALNESINTEVDSVDWDELAEIDPTEYLKKQRALEKKSKVLTKAQEQQQALIQQQAVEESKILTSKMTAWSGENGESTRKADTDLALKYAANIGFTDNDLSGVTDHRVYLMMIDAAKYQALQSKAPAIKKKVAKAPRVTPTSRAAKRKVSTSEESRNRLRKTGNDKDAKSAILNYLNGANKR